MPHPSNTYSTQFPRAKSARPSSSLIAGCFYRRDIVPILMIIRMMSTIENGLGDLKEAVLEDAWYELEGAYEVYAFGRCRFVLFHCRMAMLIGIGLLANRKGVPSSGNGIEAMVKDLGMPEHIVDSCKDIDRVGRYDSILRKCEDEQQHAAAILSKTLEVFEWIRGKLGNV